jgi:hypothetical protein
MNIMSGYGVHIRALTDEDIRIHNIDMGDHDPDRCIAVEGEDLGPTLCAVIEMTRTCPDPLVWSEVPTAGPDPEWHEITDSTFADALAHVVSIIIPEVGTPA